MSSVCPWIGTAFDISKYILIKDRPSLLPVTYVTDILWIVWKISMRFRYIPIDNEQLVFSGLFYQHGLTLIPSWISNYIHYKVWDEIIYPFLNFNGWTVEV